MAGAAIVLEAVQQLGLAVGGGAVAAAARAGQQSPARRPSAALRHGRPARSGPCAGRRRARPSPGRCSTRHDRPITRSRGASPAVRTAALEVAREARRPRSRGVVAASIATAGVPRQPGLDQAAGDLLDMGEAHVDHERGLAGRRGSRQFRSSHQPARQCPVTKRTPVARPRWVRGSSPRRRSPGPP